MMRVENLSIHFGEGGETQEVVRGISFCLQDDFYECVSDFKILCFIHGMCYILELRKDYDYE